MSQEHPFVDDVGISLIEVHNIYDSLYRISMCSESHNPQVITLLLEISRSALIAAGYISEGGMTREDEKKLIQLIKERNLDQSVEAMKAIEWEDIQAQ